ncbi:P-loop containing nucleoside triphosphate hydrolase protein [Dipodascopsis tothii]|uniref:P-loop containing nucleoside triphosphate hydrolase protein n=1 Tax=Dipodascopsis tothii TaxID=44089 RepID=UPI0034CEB174
MAPSIAQQIRGACPKLDPVVQDYASGYLYHHVSTLDSALERSVDAGADLHNELLFVRQLLVDAGGDTEAVQKLTAGLWEQFQATLQAKLEKAGGADRQGTVRKLEQAMVIGAQRGVISSVGLFGTETDLEAVGGRRVESKVDKKKLEKAERKIAAKLEKRAMKTVEYEASRLLRERPKEDYDEFYMQVNPLLLGSAAAGKSKDIKLDNIDLYVGAGQRILSDTTLTLAHGHRYGLIGQNGIGKSTLLRALSRRELAVPKHITILHVEQELVGDDTPALQAVLDADVWRKHLLQEQHRILTRLAELDSLQAAAAEQGDRGDDGSAGTRAQIETEREELDTTLVEVHSKLSEIESEKAEPRAASILAGLGFSKEAQQNPTNSFSGGWRMRLALARALFCKPDLLLLDEPSNMLDVPSITFLSYYLQGYPGTVLVVSHDRAFLNEVATDIIHQHSERLDYYRSSNFDVFYATREERRKNQRREYETQMAYRKHLQTFIDKFRYNAAKSSEAQSRIKKLEKLPVLELPEEDATVTFRFPEVEKISPPILQLQNVSFAYPASKRLVLTGVDMDVQMDSRIALVGANGSGKTTLLKVLTQATEPTSGLVSRNGRLRIGYFAQHHVDGMDLNLSAVAWMTKNWPGKSDEEYRRHLGAFGITGTLGLQKMQLLSGGQKSRVAFACLGLTNPHILVLDEPSNHLDTAGLDALADAVRKFEGGVLMVSHDVTLIDRTMDQIWVCEDGAVNKFPGTIHDYKREVLARSDAVGLMH